MSLDGETGRQAGELRARYNITLPDALQISSALAAGCEAFLTNDVALNRVTDLNVITFNDVSPA